MKSRTVLVTGFIALVLASLVVLGQGKGKHFNPNVDLLNDHAVQIGVSYAAARGGTPPAPLKFDPPPPPTPTPGSTDVCGYNSLAEGDGPAGAGRGGAGNAGRGGGAPGGAGGGRGGDQAAGGRGA